MPSTRCIAGIDAHVCFDDGFDHDIMSIMYLRTWDHVWNVYDFSGSANHGQQTRPCVNQPSVPPTASCACFGLSCAWPHRLCGIAYSRRCNSGEASYDTRGRTPPSRTPGLACSMTARRTAWGAAAGALTTVLQSIHHISVSRDPGL